MVVASAVLGILVQMGTRFAMSHVTKSFEGLAQIEAIEPDRVAVAVNLPAETPPVEIADVYLTGDGHAFVLVQRSGLTACGLLAVTGVLLCVAAWKLPQADKQ